MTKPITQTKPLTVIDASAELKTVIDRLVLGELQFTVIHKPNEKQVIILSVLHCDSVKVICPAFVVDTDEHCKRFAKLVISYE